MDKFTLNNQIEKILRGENSSFLNIIEFNYVVNRIKNRINYNVFRLYDECEKVIIYTNKLDISLFEIECKSDICHREILGSLFSHNLSESSFGDIVVSDKCYITLLNKVKDYMLNNYKNIGKKKVNLIEKELDTLKDFKPSFKEININISSLRIDNVISKLIPTSRNIAQSIIKDKKVLVNYEIISNYNYILKENDIFSIRGIGKFKYIGINSVNKNGKLGILIKKYI